MKPLQILIADDHPALLEGIAALLSDYSSHQIVGKAKNGLELIELAKTTQPDIILTDIEMPFINGIEATRKIKQQNPEIGIIALSNYMNDDYIIRMLEAGAYGYLLKDADTDELAKAIKVVFGGNRYYDERVNLKLHELISRTGFNPYRKVENIAFTPHELRIIEKVCLQLSLKEIAESIRVPFKTLEKQKQKIQDKLGVKNSVGIAIYALKNKLVEIKE